MDSPYASDFLPEILSSLTGYEPSLTAAHIKNHTIPTYLLIPSLLHRQMADASPIYAMVSIFTTDDERIRIPKLRGAENYRPWSIYVQATLESKGCWDIVTGTRKTPATLEPIRPILSKKSIPNIYRVMRQLEAY